MVKIRKSYTINIEKDGQKITIGPEEMLQIKGALEEALREKGREVQSKAAVRSPKARMHISEEKKKQVLEHLGKRLSSRPQTLSSLLEGVSYVPNTLPVIRKMLEAQKNVAKKMVGKRTLYFRK